MTAKEKQAAQLTTVCILALGTVLFGVWFSRLFSPPELGLSAHAEAPVLISCQELQRELNRRHPKLKLKVDGKCGPATMAAWDAEVNTQYALKLWPEDAK